MNEVIVTKEDREAIKQFLTDVRESGNTNIYSAFAMVPKFFGVSREVANVVIEEWKKDFEKKVEA